MQDTFARACTRPMQPLGQARATIGYLVYNVMGCYGFLDLFGGGRDNIFGFLDKGGGGGVKFLEL